MTNKEKLDELYRQLKTSYSQTKKYQLTKAIHRIEKQIKKEKLGMNFKDGVYWA